MLAADLNSTRRELRETDVEIKASLTTVNTTLTSKVQMAISVTYIIYELSCMVLSAGFITFPYIYDHVCNNYAI